MQRILRSTAPTIYGVFDVDGVATDPSPNTATVTITASDGAVLVDAQSATDAAGDGQFSYTLTVEQTAQLDTLTIEWTSALGTITDTVEIVGGFLFSIADMRALEPLSSTAKYPTATLIAARTLAEQALEDACAVAFVPRYRQETLDGTGTTSLLLSRPRVTAIRSVTVDAVAYTADQLAALALGPYGQVTGTSSWTAGAANVTVGYEHGYPTPPLRVGRAALLLARAWLVSGPVDDRAATFDAGAEGGTYSLVVPGRNGSIVGLPEVDATIQQYGMQVGLA